MNSRCFFFFFLISAFVSLRLRSPSWGIRGEQLLDCTVLTHERSHKYTDMEKAITLFCEKHMKKLTDSTIHFNECVGFKTNIEQIPFSSSFSIRLIYIYIFFFYLLMDNI